MPLPRHSLSQDEDGNGRMILADRFRLAMRVLASGVAVVTSFDREGRPFGMAATSVTSLSMDPPSLLICINKSSSIVEPLTESGRFSVSLLKESQSDIMECFGGPRLAEKRFSFGNWVNCEGGALYLEDALASIECIADAQWDYGTHLIVVGKAVSTGPVAAGERPLVYYDGAANSIR